MRKLFLVLAFVAASAFSASAQTPQTNLEGYVGVQYDRSSFDYRDPNSQAFSFNRSTDSVGLDVAGTAFVAKNVGLTADVSATFKGGRNDGSLVTALGGLTVKARSNARFQPFVRALAGVARERTAFNQLNTNFSDSDTSLAGLVGGGLDINVSRNSRYKVRLIQVDYLHTNTFDNGARNFLNGGNNHLRLGAGFVF